MSPGVWMGYRREQWEAAIRLYLEDLHCSVWGRAMSVSQPEERSQVARELFDRLLGPVVERIESGELDS